MPTSDINSYRAEFFENSEMLISLYDKDLNLIDANAAFLTGLKLKKEDIIGKNINDISPDCKPSGRYKIYEDIIHTGGRYVADQVRLHPDLGSIYIRLTAFKVGDGLGISSKDITDLVETIQDLETFIYKTSHDIRSPISTTLGLLNVARHDLKEIPEALKYVDMIRQQTELLDQIVFSLVETTKIRQGQKNLQIFNFEEVLKKVIFSFSDHVHFNRVTITQQIEGSSELYSDKTLLAIILQNLIHNSVKYRDERKQPCLINISLKTEGDKIRLSVEDNGLGIEETAQNDVFKMFFRGTNVSGGNGLGLYTVKHCVKKLGGQIVLKSQPGLGTIFTLELPNLKTPQA